MGYDTDFNGAFMLGSPLTAEQHRYLTAFSRTRRMKRSEAVAKGLADPAREAVGLPLGGPEAPYFTGGGGYAGQDRDGSVVGYNTPPDGQPGLWCQWIPRPDGTAIEWDGGEKFYHYTEWIQYLIHHFLAPWGHTLTGHVDWYGEDRDDLGILVVLDNKVRERRARIEFHYKEDE
jgi:hypothetical protein